MGLIRRSRKRHGRRRQLFRGPARCKVTAAAPAPTVRRGLLLGQRRVDARPAPPPIDTQRRSGFSPNAHPPTKPERLSLTRTRPEGLRIKASLLQRSAILGNSKFSTRLGTTIKKHPFPSRRMTLVLFVDSTLYSKPRRLPLSCLHRNSTDCIRVTFIKTPIWMFNIKRRLQ
uniref:Uncharacterized protein n=1 Tax=Schizaphis graminum TaxID=13262 RepID=A0A2S2PF04_SCHGA